MKKILNYVTYSIYSFFCFAIAAYAFYFLLQPLDPNNGFQVKMFSSGIQVPIHFIASGIALFIIPFQLSKKLRNHSKTLHRNIGKVYTWRLY